MEREKPTRSVIIRLRISPSGRLEAVSSHGPGAEREVRGTAGQHTPLTGEEKASHLRSPSEATSAIAEAVANLTQDEPLRAGAEGRPLAVFVEPARLVWDGRVAKRGRDWESTLHGILLPRGFGREHVSYVRLAEREWSPRPRFRLPLRVLAVGRRADAALRSLREAEWIKRDPEIRRYGIHLEKAAPRYVPDALRSEIRDIVVVDEESVEAVLREASALPEAAISRPRLVVFFGRSRSALYAYNVVPPPGVSLLWAPLTDADYDKPAHAAEFLKRLVYNISHDQPLHEALKGVTGGTKQIQHRLRLAHRPLLVADPLSNHDLRMSDAAAQLINDASTLNQTISVVGERDVDDFVRRVRRDFGGKSDELHEVLKDVLVRAKDAQVIRDALHLTRQLSYDFGRETTGLAPLARAEAVVAKAHEAERHLGAALAGVVSQKEVAEAVHRHQERRVDVALQHVEGLPVYRPVDPHNTLKQGARYRVRLHIGHRLQDSLMTGKVPPLDPLLSEPKEGQGHTLEVVFHEDEFTLISERIQSLYLPLLGGSRPVYFEIRAPQGEGAARARIMVYHQNNLLQSFALEAQVAPDESRRPDRQVSVKLLTSSTARFANLQELAPRAVSLGLSDARRAAGGEFTVKSDKGAEALSLPADLIKNELRRFRKILRKATTDRHGNPLFSTVAPPASAPSEEFSRVIRELAKLGNELYRAIFKRMSHDVQDEMRRLATTADETIQITRYDVNYAFPWNIMYDFRTPNPGSAADKMLVCMGFKRAEEGGAAAAPVSEPRACGHGPDDAVYCVWGFWGLRHRIEELVAMGDSLKNLKPNIEAAPERPVVGAVIGTPDDNTEWMLAELRAALGDRLVELAPDEDLLKFLWEPDKRPAVVIVLGHMETKPRPPRIQIGESKWLSSKDIEDQFISHREWEEQPNSLVLLMACSSGATEMTTVNDFVSAWTSVGAAGIVGTECLTFSRLVCSFAKDVTCDLLSPTAPKSLGDTVKEFNRRMVRRGNPLGFVFNSLGSADLKIILGGD